MKIVRTLFIGFVAIAVGSAVSTRAATKHVRTLALSGYHCAAACKTVTHAGFGVSTERVARAKARRVAAKPQPKEMRVIGLVAGQ